MNPILPFYLMAWICHSDVPSCVPRLAAGNFTSVTHFATLKECERAVPGWLHELPIVDGDTIIAGCRQVEGEA